ncbi:hypothetical protein O3G_MSEX003035 [Manduca sexta]|uniref:unspecific monooxygenase n=3 Tax=Manduca sexta TaxID=7130 RepID=A0A921YQK3_MANSE|nr:hypothetical protein O3G_MSEX003035 [Manduca sexta]
MELYGALMYSLFVISEEWRFFILISTVIALYFYYTSTFDHFEKKGIPFMKPVILFGNLGPRFKAKKSFHQYQLDIYQYFKGHPYGGIFEGRKPVLYILDPDLLKAIVVRDFEHFTDRMILNSKEPVYARRFLLNLKGSEWKGVRSTLTPAFSSARLRNMLPLIEQCSKQMVDFLRQYDSQEVEMKETMGHFTLEVIGACAFGIECDALNSERSHFLRVAEKFDYMPKYKRMFLLSILLFMPKLLPYLNLSFLNTESTDELVRMLKAAKAERKAAGSKSKDFLQILVDFAKKETPEMENGKTKIELDDDTIDAQCLLFLIAGYETSSSLLSFALHALATKPDIQDKLRHHINEVTEGKEITYELLSQLPYLEGFLLETLRIHPPVARIDRVCTKPYTLPGTSITLNVGDSVAIPLYGYHMDPNIYPDPHEFMPERFMNNNKSERPSHLFLAFGAGPRNCIGLRFAMLSAKAAMIALMKNFRFSVCPKTVDPIKLNTRSILIKAETGLWVRIESL